MAQPRHILIIGGGITGLAAAHHVRELAASRGLPLRSTLLESSNHLGGAIRTIQHDGFLIELGPDNFITNKPGAVSLCKRLGLESQLLPTNDANRRAMVVRRGKLMPIPEGFELMAPRNMYAMARSPIFSLRGKLRMWMEQFVKPPGNVEDESLESFVVRRFGREALDRLIQPLIGGIYTADPKMLSLRATVPRFLDMEAQHGSIIRAMKHEKKQRKKAESNKPAASTDTGARYSMFMTLRDGMSQLPAALAAKLGDTIQLNRRVIALARSENQWRVDLADGSHLSADGVVIAAPSFVAGQLLAPLDGPLSTALNSIEYASSAIVVAAYRRDQVTHPLDAFGFVVPTIENRSIIAGSFSHVKYPGRAPQGCVLLRAFIGGATQEGMMKQDDAQMVATMQREFESLLGVSGPPMFTHVQRWPRSMPQYFVGHMKLVESIRSMTAKHHGLELTGSGYDGVGIPDCVTSAERAVERLI